MALSEERCVACRADSPRVTEEEITLLRAQVPEWHVVTEDGVLKLERRFRVRNFRQALALSNAIGEIAEAEDHHPRLVTEWGAVTVTWWTHAINGLHRNDFVMSAKTDRIFVKMLDHRDIEPPPVRRIPG